MGHYDNQRYAMAEQQHEEQQVRERLWEINQTRGLYMKTSNEGKVEIIGHEGICLSKYKDSVGVWTIAVGATRSEIPDLASWPLSKVLTMKEVFELFGKSLVKYEDAVNKALTRVIPQYQFDALVSWCYNVGVGYTKPVYDKKGNMTRDTATVLRLLNKGASGAELYKALMMYRKPPEITGRRTKEANLLAYGKYSGEGKALLFPVSSRGYPMYTKAKSINVWQYIPYTTEEPSIPEVESEKTKLSLFQRGLNLLDKYLS